MSSTFTRDPMSRAEDLPSSSGSLAEPFVRRMPLELSFGNSMHGLTGHESLYAFGESDVVRGSMVGLLSPGSSASPRSQPLDSRGRPYALPVDSEHKARRLKLWSLSRPHMMAFHLSVLSFFTSFLSTFSPAALMSVIRDDLNMTQHDIGVSNVAAVIGTIGSRIILGFLCDSLGPRFAMAATLLATAPAAFGLALCKDAESFFALRFLLGLSLGCFVPNQYWTSAMFSPKVIGLANGLAAGFGNCGGGFTHLILPLVYSQLVLRGVPNFISWRYALFLPGCLHILAAVLVLVFTEDSPDGNFSHLRSTGQMNKASAVSTWRLVKYACSNYRTWILVIAYSCSFGIELTFDNVATTYFVDLFDMGVQRAGYFGSLFGMMAFIMRPAGGYVSDVVAKQYGMRGRIWTLYLANAVGCSLAMVLAVQHDSLPRTIAALVCFSLGTLFATGAAYGVVPFISKRALGVINGLVGGGGNAGAAIWQFAFFTSAHMSAHESVFYMGLAALVLCTPILGLYWPAWGGAFAAPSKSASEEQYFLHDYSLEEIQAGDAMAALLFAAESRYQRGGASKRNDGTSAEEGGKNPSTRFTSPFTASEDSRDPSSPGNTKRGMPPAPGKRVMGFNFAPDGPLSSVTRSTSFEGFAALAPPSPSAAHGSSPTVVSSSLNQSPYPHLASTESVATTSYGVYPNDPPYASGLSAGVGSFAMHSFSSRLDPICEGSSGSSPQGSIAETPGSGMGGFFSQSNVYRSPRSPRSPQRAHVRGPGGRVGLLLPPASGHQSFTRAAPPPAFKTSLSSPSLQAMGDDPNGAALLGHAAERGMVASEVHPRVFLHEYSSSSESDGEREPATRERPAGMEVGTSNAMTGSKADKTETLPEHLLPPRWSAPVHFGSDNGSHLPPLAALRTPTPTDRASRISDVTDPGATMTLPAVRVPSGSNQRRSVPLSSPSSAPYFGRAGSASGRGAMLSTAPLQILQPSKNDPADEVGGPSNSKKALVKRFSFQDLPSLMTGSMVSNSSATGVGMMGSSFSHSYASAGSSLAGGMSRCSSSKNLQAAQIHVRPASRLNRSSTNPRFTPVGSASESGETPTFGGRDGRRTSSSSLQDLPAVSGPSSSVEKSRTQSPGSGTAPESES